MSRWTLITSAALIAIAGFTSAEIASAQDESAGISGNAAIYESIPAADKEPPPAVTEFVKGQAKMQLLATDFMGLAVADASGTTLGTIDDVLFDESGKLSVIVLNVSDLVGADKRIAFNLSDLRRKDEGDLVKLVASIDRQQIEAAPHFKSLSEEMSLNDGQSLTEGQAEGQIVEPPAN